jgi:outer membrane protein assembly factor BamB
MPGPGPGSSPGVVWRYQADGALDSSVALANGLAYLIVSKGELVAIDTATGRARWKASLPTRAQTSAVLAAGLVIVGADDGLHAFDATSGRPAWTALDSGTIRGTPAVVGDTMFSASATGLVQGRSIRTGGLSWSVDVGVGASRSVAAIDGLLVIGLDSGTILGLSTADGSNRFGTDSGDAGSIGTPAIAGGRIYAATGLDAAAPGPGHHQILALSLAGDIAWKYASPADRPVYTPAVANGLAIVDGEDQSIVALDAATGRPVWRASVPGVDEVVAAISAGTVYSATNGGYVLAVDARTGMEDWRVKISGVPFAPVVAGGRVYVGTSLGQLIAIGDGS